MVSGALTTNGLMTLPASFAVVDDYVIVVIVVGSDHNRFLTVVLG